MAMLKYEGSKEKHAQAVNHRFCPNKAKMVQSDYYCLQGANRNSTEQLLSCDT